MNIRCGYKVFRRDETGLYSIRRGYNVSYTYRLDVWNYAIVGPFFVFDSKDRAHDFVISCSLGGTTWDPEVRPVFYVPVTPRRPSGVRYGGQISLDDPIEVRNYWTKNTKISPFDLLSLPPGTLFAVAVWIGEKFTEPLISTIEPLIKAFQGASNE